MRAAAMMVTIFMMTSLLWSQPKVLIVDDFESDF